jgi:hypothetical protein
VSKKLTRPKVLWSNRINFGGLYSAKPVKCTERSNDYGKPNEYWSKDGDYDAHADQLGVVAINGCVTFTSRSKEEVELWTLGARSALAAVRRFCEVE